MSETESFTVNGNVEEFELIEVAARNNRGSISIYEGEHEDLYGCYQDGCDRIGVWAWYGENMALFLCDDCVNRGGTVEFNDQS